MRYEGLLKLDIKVAQRGNLQDYKICSTDDEIPRMQLMPRNEKDNREEWKMTADEYESMD